VIPRLHLILDLETLAALDREPLTVATAAADGGVGAVHLRAPDRPAGALLELAQALVLVNDRLDVALASGAGGVQLPAAGLPPGVARRLVESAGRHWRVDGAPFLIGCSVHDPEQARAAGGDADFLLLGTVFASRSHPGRAPGGEALVRAVRAATRLPLIAIGGITADTAAQAIAAGADGVAAIRAIVEAPDPGEAAARLLAAIHDYSREEGPGSAGVSPVPGGPREAPSMPGGDGTADVHAPTSSTHQGDGTRAATSRTSMPSAMSATSSLHAPTSKAIPHVPVYALGTRSGHEAVRRAIVPGAQTGTRKMRALPRCVPPVNNPRHGAQRLPLRAHG
jgi:thiamine-phosphate pyrophosphorylase